ncbi:hypothetical protein Vafri_21132 [Volvox africanus]|uniref:Uncharacterized protein n=1 Tax=Volvox africanus TaxID=51714 RepID=A0A8J4BT13_9CHLO|nr:hypothetical protein Vafri_21132 [Volvox africanus]
MASGGDELGLTGGGSQADLTTVPRMSWRGPFDQSIDHGVQDPVALPVLQTPAHPFVPLAATTVGPARNEEQGRPPSSLHQGHDDGDEDPAYDAAHVDQGTDVRSPTAATTVVHTDQGRSVRGASGPGTRVSSGAGPSSGPVRGKRKGGPPSAAAAHGAGNEAKRQRTDDLWLKKWGCTQSELTRRRKEKVCLRCAGGHPTRDCPMLPPLAQQPK